MFYSKEYKVEETKSAFIVSKIDGEDKVRIEKELIEKIPVNEESKEMVGIILAIIEHARYAQMTDNHALVDERIIENEDILSKIYSSLEYKQKSVDWLVDRLERMKHNEVLDFFNDEFEGEIY